MTVSAVPAESIGVSFTPFEDRVEVIEAVAAHAEARGLAFVAVAEAMSLAAPIVPGTNMFDPNYRSPRSVVMNIGIQRELRPGMVLSVDFIRNVQTHFLLGVDQNHAGDTRFDGSRTAATLRGALHFGPRSRDRTDHGGFPRAGVDGTRRSAAADLCRGPRAVGGRETTRCSRGRSAAAAELPAADSSAARRGCHHLSQHPSCRHHR